MILCLALSAMVCIINLFFICMCSDVEKNMVSVSRKLKAAVMEGKLMWPAVSSVNKCFREKVLMSMKEDDVKKIVLKDPVIMQYGERMFMKKDVQEHTPNYISRRMRIMGKLMQVLHRPSSGRERISTPSVCPKTCCHISHDEWLIMKLCMYTVCRVPYCQQCVTFWWWPSDPIKFKKSLKI